MTLVILSRQIDISIGSQFSRLRHRRRAAGQDGLADAAGGGSAHGRDRRACSARSTAASSPGLGLPSIVVTLATMVILREALRWWREGEFVRQSARRLSVVRPGQERRAVARRGDRGWSMFAVFAWGLRNLAAGRAVYATGSDPEAAWLAGIRPRRVTFGVFVAHGRR